MKTNTLESYQYHYLFDSTNRDNQFLYFKMKNKYEYTFSENEKKDFQSEVLSKLNEMNLFKEAELLVIPETGNECFKEIAKTSKKEVIILNKESKETILQNLEGQQMMKAEKQKLMTTINDMPIVKMAGIAGNQRKRLITCLFEELNLTMEQKEKKILFFDDSIFSGFTFLAAQHRLQNITHENIVLFNRQANQ